MLIYQLTVSLYTYYCFSGHGRYTPAVSQKKRLIVKAQSECMLNGVITKQEPPELYHQPAVCHGHPGAMCKEPYHHYVAQEQHIVLPYARYIFT